MKATFSPLTTLRILPGLRSRLNSRLRAAHRHVGRISRQKLALRLLELGLEAQPEPTPEPVHARD